MRRRELIFATLAGASLPLSLARASLPTSSHRTAIVLAGDYERYNILFEAFISRLADNGLITDVRPRRIFGIERHYSALHSYPAASLWKALAAYGDRKHLTFLPDAFYNYKYDAKTGEKERTALLSRLQERHDIDLILTFGTQPCMDMLQHVKTLPVLSLDCPAADILGIPKKIKETGQENLHVRLDQGDTMQQIALFQRYFRFKKLGMVYAKPRALRSRLKEVQEACKKLGIELLAYGYDEYSSGTKDFNKAFAQVKSLVKHGIQAIYLPYIRSNGEQFRDLVDYLVVNDIPSFSQTGAEDVRCGILLGMSDKTLAEYGAYEAWVLNRILHGEKPGRIENQMKTVIRLAVNLKTARDMDIPLNIHNLLMLDETYTEYSSHSGETF